MSTSPHTIRLSQNDMLQLSGDDITSNGWVIPDYTLQSRATKD